ncbi:MAG: DoxX family protein [Thermomicrobiales bacterium]
MSSPTPSTSSSPSTPASAPVVRSASFRIALAGWIVSGVVVLFTFIDGITKMAHAGVAVDGTVSLGFPEKYLFGIGLTLVICSLIYLIPFTSLVGAVLLTGYLGGATAIQVRVESANFLFALALGILAWIGLLLRDPRLRAFLRESLIG